VFSGPIIANICYTKDIAEGVIRSGAADMVSFGRPFISNPDLVERFTNDWPLAADAPYAHWWVPSDGPIGYTDYPAFVPPTSDVVDV
jgi:N-ethylmaleimide reductase